MKRTFLFTLLFSMLLSSNAFSIEVPIITPNPNPHIQNTIKPSNLLSVQVSSNLSDLAICFGNSTGMYTLSIEDESGRLVYQETVTVTTGLIYYLPIDMLEKGNYILTVSTDNDLLFETFPAEIN